MQAGSSKANIQSPKALSSIDFWLSLMLAALPFLLKGLLFSPTDGIPYKVLYALLKSVTETPQLLAAVVLFTLLIIALHLGYAWLVWRAWLPISQRLNQPVQQRLLLSLLVFSVLQVGLIALNSWLFPNSGIPIVAPLPLMAMGLLCLLAVLSWHCWQRITQVRNTSNGLGLKRSIGLLFSVLLLASFLTYPGRDDSGSPSSRTRPDIIIIGIDSFRPDHLQQPGDKTTITPNLDKFIQSAYWFKKTYTPLSRTYPAWMSILTGRYPLDHGGRFNLINPDHLIDKELSLPFILKTHHYITAYAIDETRFSNIDKRYGFDITLSPAIGAADFLLSESSDLPLSNLLSLVPKLQALLFPYQFMNRAVHKTYDPDVFDAGLAGLVKVCDPAQPLFLVTHFELPHWPYDWGDAMHYPSPKHDRLATLSPEAYQKAVYRSDKQFASLMNILQQNGRLNNAVVVVISDHGEGFESFSEPWRSAAEGEQISLPPFSSHGINVLDENQTRVLMAFRRFKQAEISSSAGVNEHIASLVDVAPSALFLAGIDPGELKAGGCNLFDTENSLGECQEDKRVVYTETDLYVPALTTPGNIDPNKVAAEAYSLYEVHDDTRLTLKDISVKDLLRLKQRAVISNNRMVAASLPENTSQLVVGDLNAKTYRLVKDNIKIDEQHELLKKLCQKYLGDDTALDDLCTH